MWFLVPLVHRDLFRETLRRHLEGIRSLLILYLERKSFKTISEQNFLLWTKIRFLHFQAFYGKRH